MRKYILISKSADTRFYLYVELSIHQQKAQKIPHPHTASLKKCRSVLFATLFLSQEIAARPVFTE